MRRSAESEGVALKQPINVAVAEKLSALQKRRLFPQASRPGEYRQSKADTEASRPGKTSGGWR
jgi:hypothetical protein